MPAVAQKPAGLRIEPPGSEPIAPMQSAAAAPGPRTARRAAGLVFGVPRVARRRKRLVGSHGAAGEFVGGELSEKHGAGLLEGLHGLRLDGGHAVKPRIRMAVA